LQEKSTKLTRQRQQQIMEGACRLFFEKGYHQTTTRQIAEACKMSKGQLYHYISSKIDILHLLHKHVQELWYNRFVKSDINKIQDPFEKILETLRMTMDFTIDNRKLVLFLYTQGFYLDEKEHDLTFQTVNKINTDLWENLLNEYSRAKIFSGDIPMSARFIHHSMFYFILNEVGDKRKEKDCHIDSMVDFILKGLGLSQNDLNNCEKSLNPKNKRG
jgi:AcrR family transcriptional regulator